MSKKIQFVLWLIIMIAVIILMGVLLQNNIVAKTSTVTHPVATFEIQDYGTVKMELYPEYAPNTVTNFIKLIEKGYYNNKVIYGKDDICLYVGRNASGEAENPKASLIFDNIEADSDQDYDYTIKGEFIANGFEQNTLSHEKGVISLIRNDYSQYLTNLQEESYNSGNAQIGIMMSDDSRALNGAYTGFGRITEGMDILEKIYQEAEMKPADTEGQEQATDDISQFATYPVITSATVDTLGEDYGNPEIQEAFDYNSYIYNMMSSSY